MAASRLTRILERNFHQFLTEKRIIRNSDALHFSGFYFILLRFPVVSGKLHAREQKFETLTI